MRAGLAARAAFVLLLGSVLFSWIGALGAGLDPLPNKDWSFLHHAGSLWWSGGLDGVYRDSMDSAHPFVHPPFFIWFCAAFGGLEPGWPAFFAFTAASAAMCVAAVSLLAGALSAGPGQRTTAVLAVLASGPWIGCMVTGQVSAAQLLALGAGLALWRRDRPLLAGLALSLLAVKPQLLLPLVAFAAVARQWRAALGMLAGIALLVASTAPFGVALWRDYFASTAHIANVFAAGNSTLWKQRTLLACLSWIAGRPPDSALVAACWAAAVLPLALGSLAAWWRGGAGQLPRLLGIAVLLVVAASPYLFFYDGLLLALPGLVWWLQRDRYASRRLHRACGLLLGAIYAWEYVNMALAGAGLPPLVGLLVSGWLALELLDLRAGRRARFAGREA